MFADHQFVVECSSLSSASFTAGSGHPGAPMGLAPLAHVLFSKIMKFNPKNPNWLNRDRFVLSNGHACALLYIMLHFTGYNLTMDDLKAFRQLNSKTPGHPENHLTEGVEVTTGPLGQGLTNAVGMAIAQKYMQSRFDFQTGDQKEELLDHYVYVIAGDGCLMEGITSEASSLAGHLNLGNLILFYDDNSITIDGKTDIAFTEDVLKRYESYGWHTQIIEDGNSDLEGMEKAIHNAQQERDRPSLIAVRTTIGFGSQLEGSSKVHGAPLSEDDINSFKQRFGLPADKFHVPQEVYDVYHQAAKRGADAEEKWVERFQQWRTAHPEQAKTVDRLLEGRLPDGWEQALPRFTSKDSGDATRKISGMVLNQLAPLMPEMFGGSADLAESNLTNIKGEKDFQKGHFDGKNIRFGVREHAMAAIGNGIAAYRKGALIPYVATFLNFMGYMFGAARLSALSHFRVIYIMTHDSIGLGEDGPTHQPVEVLAMLRATPNFFVFRPADGNEVSGAYMAAIKHVDGPTTICLSRQTLPQLENSSVEKTAEHGAYTVYGEEHVKPDLVFISTGSEVSICVDAAMQLTGKKIRVVSAPCMEIFAKQSIEYKKEVLPDGVPVVSVEAGATFGWDRYSHVQLGLETFGASGPYQDVYKFFGLTPETVAKKAEAVIEHYSGKTVYPLFDKPQF